MGATRAWRGVVIGFALPLLATAAPALAGTAPFGTARGLRDAAISLDRGQTWLPLERRSMPVNVGARVRSNTGVVLLHLADGSRVNLLPLSEARFDQPSLSLPNGRDLDVVLEYGRAKFRLPENTRVGLLTPTAQVEPIRSGPMEGDLFADRAGTTGVRLTEGVMVIRELGGAQRTFAVAREPVFVPERPPGHENLFAADGPAAAPPDAKPIFNAEGKSVGYLRPDLRLVVAPGFAANLTRPFPAETVRQAQQSVPEEDRAKALPLFDVNGAYAGYVVESMYYPAAPATSTAAAGTGPTGAPFDDGGTSWTTYAIGGAAIVGGGLGIAAIAGGGGGDDSPPAASQVGP